MISLKDEIKRFQKMIYNKQLAEFVTVDQMFVGGGITIESMIHESNFIVEELKKMNAVFLNYCKLNEKVYQKISEHELNLHNEQGKLNSLTSSFDRKLEDVIKTMRELHESTVSENRKSLKMLEDATSPIRSELDKKVDKITFEAQMKKFLQEYDEGAVDEQETVHEGEEKMGTVNGVNGLSSDGASAGLTAQGIPLIKKKGKVGYQDFYKLQAEVHTRMKKSDEKLQQTSISALQGKDLILKYLPVINKNALDVSIHTTQIYRINHQIQEQEKQLASSIEKLNQELNQRTNDQTWNTKFTHFYDKQVKPNIANLEQSIKVMQKETKTKRQENQGKFDAIHGEIIKMKNGIQIIETTIKKQGKDILKLNEDVREHHEQFQKEKFNLTRNIDNFKSQTGIRFKQLERFTKLQIEQVRKIIQNLVHSIEQSVLKVVNKRVQSQLKAIESDVRANQSKVKSLKNDINVICQEIKNIKDILSRKANFTDIIIQVEKKADKEEFRELESRFQQSSQQFVSKIINESIILGKGEKEKPEIRTTSLTRANKTLMAPRSTSNRLNKTDFDISTKLFMCGLDGGGHLGQNRILMSQTSKRKSLKSSAAVISDFAI